MKLILAVFLLATMGAIAACGESQESRDVADGSPRAVTFDDAQCQEIGLAIEEPLGLTYPLESASGLGIECDWVIGDKQMTLAIQAYSPGTFDGTTFERDFVTIDVPGADVALYGHEFFNGRPFADEAIAVVGDDYYFLKTPTKFAPMDEETAAQVMTTILTQLGGG